MNGGQESEPTQMCSVADWLALAQGRLNTREEILGRAGPLGTSATEDLAQNVAETTATLGLTTAEDAPQDTGQVTAWRAQARRRRAIAALQDIPKDILESAFCPGLLW